MASGTIPQPSNDSGAGYCKMPDGTLIQWGNVSITRNVGINTSALTYFTVPFVQGSVPELFATTNTSAYAQYLRVFPASTWNDRFTVVLYNENTDAYSDGTVHWLAIGRWK